jgi:putative transposase
VLYCSSRTIALWKTRFEHGGTAALFGTPPGPRRRLGWVWAALAVAWVRHLRPRSFGLCRSRWCCAALALLLGRLHGVTVSRETVRRWLRQGGLVWRRPRPVLERKDPEREAILGRLRGLLRHLADDETVVFQDEADLNLNPDVGCAWMARGEQAPLPTPGDNEKGYLAGSLHWRTGALFETVGPKRNGELFVAHLEELCRRLRRYRVIHVICDNAKFHKGRAVQRFLAAHPGRVVLHYLPRYAPECNPVERVWWRLREAITRNHSCQTLEELIELVLRWLTERRTFRVQDSVYQPEAIAGPNSQSHDAA